MRERHWSRVYHATGLDQDQDRKTWTLDGLLQQGIDKHMAVLAEIAELATKELVVERSVDRVDQIFSTYELDVGPAGIVHNFKPILKKGDEVLQSVDEALVRLQAIVVSAYVDPHVDRVNYWVTTLTGIRDLLECWNAVQRKYLFLEPLFSSESLLRKMPIEGRSFAVVDQAWTLLIEARRELPLLCVARGYCMRPTESILTCLLPCQLLGPNPRLVEVSHQKQLMDKLEDLMQRLEQIAK